MIAGARHIGHSLLARAGLRLMRSEYAQALECEAGLAARLTHSLPQLDGESRRTVEALGMGHSQIGQDLFVLRSLGWKREGWFVEFGATDGVTLSNTWLLEQHFGWTGVLAEPGRCWHKALHASGRKAAIDTDCLWSRSGEELIFHEAGYAPTSTLAPYKQEGVHDRAGLASYPVRTVSLADLLERHGAPREIDYLSVDIEGSEYEVLRDFPFDRWRFRVITCEHNWGPDRAAMQALLASHGYVLQFPDQTLFEDWYLLAG